MGNQLAIIEKLNNAVASVIGQETLQGFEKAFVLANATQELQTLLTPEYMKPIMALQGNKLGFKTDKDRQGGYPEKAVKNCLIEAVLTGLQPHGNQFNIIAGNMYPTKEGFQYLLSNMPGLNYEVISELPRINNTSTSAAIVMNIYWSLNGGKKQHRQLDLPIKVNSHMGTDAVIGKATRKARAWLYNTITGSEISDGDIQDLDSASHLTVSIDPKKIQDKKEYDRVLDHIRSSTTLKKLEQVKDLLKDDENLNNEYILQEEFIKDNAKK